MSFKPAQQGSHLTLIPFHQTLGFVTPSAGEAVRSLAGGWGALAQKDCTLEKAFAVRGKR